MGQEEEISFLPFYESFKSADHASNRAVFNDEKRKRSHYNLFYICLLSCGRKEAEVKDVRNLISKDGDFQKRFEYNSVNDQKSMET